MNKPELYYVKTYGCQMNVHESEKIAAILRGFGYEETANIQDASIIVFNTCAIRDSAEQKIYGNIGAVKKLKQQNPNLIFAVCGCMTQMQGRADIIKQKYPHVNIVFGTHNLSQFKDYLLNYKTNGKNIYEVWENEKEISEDVEAYRTSKHNAWVNIMYGCNNFCTYCIVPFVRGRERSRDSKEIIEEVKTLVSQGYKYITLLGQNVNSYGNDKKGKDLTFAQLLNALSELEGDFKIKFMTSHPKDINSDVIDVIAKYPKISKAIHLPIQSGSNKILKSMNRGYTKEHYLAKLEEIKAKIPNVYISTDIIVGFPGETEEDFIETLNLVKQVQYDGLFGFMYSPRTGTIAESMDNQIDKDIKNQRVNKLLTLSKKIIKDKVKQMLNQVIEVIVDDITFINGSKFYVATTDTGRSVLIKDAKELPVGEFIEVKITEITGAKLIAEIL